MVGPGLTVRIPPVSDRRLFALVATVPACGVGRYGNPDGASVSSGILHTSDGNAGRKPVNRSGDLG